MEMPTGKVTHVPVTGGESFHIGAMKIRIIEDGSNTDKRLSIGEFVVPPRQKGPPPHYHLMHDETFLVTKGTLRFHGVDGKIIDAKVGDYIIVGTDRPHTFSNPFDEEAVFILTCTPSYYINYFKILSTMGKAGVPMSPEANRRAMAYFATIGVSDEELKGDGSEAPSDGA